MSVESAASAFRVNKKQARPFERLDPFNNVVVKGFICRKKGKMGGSLFITHVDGKEVEPQLIYGTPKLAYPYKDESTEYLNFPKNSVWYFLAEKWNGMNVLFFKYRDADGKVLVSAKSKGAPFLADGEFGPFLTLCRKALGAEPTDLPWVHQEQDDIQAVSYELCGTLEPHLVKYDFDVELKPLFHMDSRGRIRPVLATDEDRLHPFPGSDKLVAICRESQQLDLEDNKSYRKHQELDLKYEFEHFFTEGKVLYLLDEDGVLVNRTMFKIKPSDVEEVHWQTFDSTMEGRVMEALMKIKLNEDEINESSLQHELDMGPKEWGKFGKKVMKFVESLGA